MSKFRYTTKELKEFDDYKMLRCVVLDRQDGCTNVYGALYKRLDALYNKLSAEKPLTKSKNL